MSSMTMASAISFSPTPTISSTWRSMRPRVRPLGRFTAMPSARVAPALDRCPVALVPGEERGADGGLDGDDLHLRGEGVDGAGDTRDEPSAAEGHDDHGEVVDVLDELETECPLSRHDGRIVEGVDEVKAGLEGRASASTTQSSSESPSRWTEAP